jgi:hypothetical protein
MALRNDSLRRNLLRRDSHPSHGGTVKGQPDRHTALGEGQCLATRESP